MKRFERVCGTRNMDLSQKEARWVAAVAAARMKAEAKKKSKVKSKRGLCRVVAKPASVQPASMESESSDQPLLTPWGRPYHIFRCEHGVSRVRVCGDCGNTEPTWETVTMPYVRARRAEGFYPW